MFLMECVLEPAGERDSECDGWFVVERFFVESVGIFRLHYDFIDRIPIESHSNTMLAYPRIVSYARGDLEHCIVVFVMREDITLVINFTQRTKEIISYFETSHNRV